MKSNRDKKNFIPEPADANEMVRLSKLMSERGISSRREADELIVTGQVFVDGNKVTELGVKFPRSVEVKLSAMAERQQDQLATIILNKPVGYVSNLPEDGYEPAFVLIEAQTHFRDDDYNDERKLKPKDMINLAVVGRLDIDSQGLLLYTQDGRLAKKIIGENSEIEKEYLVRVTSESGKKLGKNIEKLRHGLSIDGQALKPAIVEWLNEDQLKFILQEGKKRQIRRMCELVGLQVRGLKRVRIGGLKLGKLPEGQWRFLTHEEISEI